MSRYTTRNALAAWLGGSPCAGAPIDQYGNPIAFGQPSLIAGVGTVYSGFNRVTDEADFQAGLPQGSKNGALIQVALPGPDVEVREAMGGATDGWKKITYKSLVRIFGRSTEQHIEIAQSVFDDVVDAVKARIRADRTLGGLVFQAGEGVYGIQAEHMLPTVDNGVIELYSQLTLQIVEHIRG